VERVAPWYLWFYAMAFFLCVVAWGSYMNVDYGSVDVCYGYVHSGEPCRETTEYDWGRIGVFARWVGLNLLSALPCCVFSLCFG
jgi:hypothetical protein